jgi:hypothetical protein
MRLAVWFSLCLFAIAAALSAEPIAAPDLALDGQTVVSPNIGAAVVPDGSFQVFDVCLNDNPANDPGNDQDFNDGCVSAVFSTDNSLTLSWVGGVTSAINYIGVWGQSGRVGHDLLEAIFSYTPGVETIFAGYVNGGADIIYLSGTGSVLNAPPGDYFYAECILCSEGDVGGVPEPATWALAAAGLAGLVWFKARAASPAR